jgi:hypothetical protein
MDAVSGQVILLDIGVAFCDNLMRLSMSIARNMD